MINRWNYQILLKFFLDISKIDTYFAFQFNAKSVQY